jgi:hypothetical protein
VLLSTYHAVGVTSKKHSKGGRKLLVSCDTTDAGNDAPQVPPSVFPDLQVQFLAKFSLKLLILSFCCISICGVNFFQSKLKVLWWAVVNSTHGYCSTTGSHTERRDFLLISCLPSIDTIPPLI